MPSIAEIGNQFAIAGDFIHGEAIPTGHINSTFRATYLLPEGTRQRYILQAINGHVFKNPRAVMANVEQVTRHINAKVLRHRHDLGGQTLNLFPARDGRFFIEDETGTLWRCYNHIEGCVTYDIVENTRQAYEAARAFGAFQHLVSDLDPALIVETIPDFHDTRKRLDRLSEVIASNPVQRLAGVGNEVTFIRDRESLTDVLPALTAGGKIPLRVVHNDTKINNVMIDARTDEAVCVIDLDTVMPGLALHDFGDLVRAAISPAAEDERDLAKVQVRLPVFRALVQGYLSTARGFLNENEIQHLVFSAKLIALELAIRFLTDHLEGDVYFKTHHENQNLDRCRTQLELVRQFELHEPEMTAIVENTGS